MKICQHLCTEIYVIFANKKVGERAIFRGVGLGLKL
jgi:hypothetical protein